MPAACWRSPSSSPRPASPNTCWYNFGNLHAADGTPNPRAQWTFGIDTRLFQALRDQGITTTHRYGLFGHSAGGQYVHRMLSFGYRERVAVAVSANAGTYAMPDLATDWPWGLGATDVTPDDLRTLLAFPLTVMAGTADTKTTGRFFPKGPKSHEARSARGMPAPTAIFAPARTPPPLWASPSPGRSSTCRMSGMTDGACRIAAAPLIAEALRRGTAGV